MKLVQINEELIIDADDILDINITKTMKSGYELTFIDGIKVYKKDGIETDTPEFTYTYKVRMKSITRQVMVSSNTEYTLNNVIYNLCLTEFDKLKLSIE